MAAIDGGTTTRLEDGTTFVVPASNINGADLGDTGMAKRLCVCEAPGGIE